MNYPAMFVGWVIGVLLSWVIIFAIDAFLSRSK